jgi:hypothetical protein
MLIDEKKVFGRLKRAMLREGHTLHRCSRNSRWWVDLGDFYSADVCTNGISGTHLDIVAEASERGLIKRFETVAE